MSIESESAAQMFSKAERNYAVFFLPLRHHGRNVSFGNRLQLKAHLKAKQRCEREQKAGTDNSFASQLHKPRRHSRITLSFPSSPFVGHPVKQTHSPKLTKQFSFPSSHDSQHETFSTATAQWKVYKKSIREKKSGAQ